MSIGVGSLLVACKIVPMKELTNMDTEGNDVYKIVLLGDEGVGKTGEFLFCFRFLRNDPF